MGLADDARKAMNGVVQIHASGWDETDIQSILNPEFVVPNEWTGSGFFVEIGKKEYIATNAHVVRNARILKIFSLLTSEEPFQVEVIGMVSRLDPDIALLQFSEGEKERFLEYAKLKSLPLLKMAKQGLVRRGEQVKAIGYPLGMTEPNISGGDVTNFISGGPMTTERLVTDAAINPGNSGGPSIIQGGEVIGVNTSVVVNANNIGFITPIDYLKILYGRLTSEGRANLCELGADLQKNSFANGEQLGVGGREGLIVTHVYRGGSLDRAGLKPTDVILAINGKHFDRHGILLEPSPFHKLNVFDVIHRIEPGAEFDITFVRDRQIHTCRAEALPFPKIAVGTQPEVQKREAVNICGMIIQQVSLEILTALNESFWLTDPFLIDHENLEIPCAIITYIEPSSEAEEASLEIGDFIVSVNEKNFKNFDEFKDILSQKPDSMLLKTRSGGFAIFRKWCD